ncbi:MAG TPA: hypothetical protein VH481_10595 [Nitrososphaeraceae archaeon]|jgi:hypothetical protein
MDKIRHSFDTRHSNGLEEHQKSIQENEIPSKTYSGALYGQVYPNLQLPFNLEIVESPTICHFSTHASQ